MKKEIMFTVFKAIAVTACFWSISTATRVYDNSFYQTPLFFSFQLGLGSAAVIYFILRAARLIDEWRYNAAKKEKSLA